MVSFLPQAQIRAGNPLLDLAQLNQGLASVQRSNELQADRAMREQQMAAQEAQQNQLLELRKAAEARQAQQMGIENRRADERMAMQRQQFQAGQADTARARQREDDMRKLQEISAGAAAAVDNPQLWQSIRQRYPDIDQDLPPEIAADPRATLQYIQRMQGGGASESTYGRSGTVVQGNDGRFYTVQFGSDGSRRILPLEAEGGVAAQPARALERVGDTFYNPNTAQPVAKVGDAIEGGEIAKARGQNRADIEKNEPKVRGAMRAFSDKVNNVNAAIDKANELISPYSTGAAGQVLSNIGGTPARNLQAALSTVQSNLGFRELQEMRDNSPTGGALGQVTERELGLLQSTVASIDQAQDAKQLQENLSRVREQFARSMEAIRAAYIETYGSLEGAPAAVRGAGGGTAPPPPPAPGTIMDGYEFIGGDPKDRNNWRLAQ